jgi:hypothetical protein
LANGPIFLGTVKEMLLYLLLGCPAVGSVLYHDAMAAIHTWDPSVAVFANALGQAGVDKDKFPTCSNYYKGMNYGDGTITNRYGPRPRPVVLPRIPLKIVGYSRT